MRKPIAIIVGVGIALAAGTAFSKVPQRNAR